MSIDGSQSEAFA